VDLRFFLSIPFSGATILALCAFASFAGFLFLNALYLQQARGFTAFRTGLYTLPLALFFERAKLALAVRTKISSLSLIKTKQVGTFART
jgi:hypothetical protein